MALNTEIILLDKGEMNVDGTVVGDQSPVALDLSDQAVRTDLRGYKKRYAVVTAGMSIVRGPFVVNYNDVGLNNGIAFYTPTVGDVLVNARIVVDAAFDGTTPRADIGPGPFGYFGSDAGSGPPPVSASDDTARGISVRDDGDPTGLIESAALATYTMGLSPFTSAVPVKAWVSQDGQAGGLAVGGTTGILRVYVVTATPRPFAS